MKVANLCENFHKAGWSQKGKTGDVYVISTSETSHCRFSMIIISRHQERKEDYLLIGKKRVSGSKLGMPRDQDRRQDRGLDPLVVVRVDAHVLLLRRERELTNVKSLGGSVGQVGLQGAANLLIGLIDVGKCGGP